VPLPPGEVRILDFKVDAYPDGRRLKVYIELTPFQKKPSGDIRVTDRAGNPVAATSFIEIIQPKNEMTLHLRSFDSEGQYTATATIFYNQGLEDLEDGAQIVDLPEKIFVDEATHPFTIPPHSPEP